MFRVLMITTLFLSVPINALADWSIIHAGQLLAVPGKAPLENASVVIHDGVITEVIEGFVSSDQVETDNEAVKIIDLSKQFVLPGLIDAHVHLTNQYSLGNTPYLFMQPEEFHTITGVKNAGLTLRSGFTTVSDVGSGAYTVYAVRDAINAGMIEGPHIIASGLSMSVTGGHADRTSHLPDHLWKTRDDVQNSQCDSVEECRYRVRTLSKRGADIIKITATGGGGSMQNRGMSQHFTDEEMRSIVETAHMLGLKVTAHAHGGGGVSAALRAGVDSIQHGTLSNKESIALFKKTGAYLVPTLLALKGSQEFLDNGTFPAIPAAKIKATLPAMHANRERLFNSGLKIAFGTDSGVTDHGRNAEEFGLLVEWGGMTPMEAIKTATVNGADNLGISDTRGTLEAGKYADIIAVDGNPLKDVKALESVAFVMKMGKVVKLMP